MQSHTVAVRYSCRLPPRTHSNASSPPRNTALDSTRLLKVARADSAIHLLPAMAAPTPKTLSPSQNCGEVRMSLRG